MYNVYKLDYKPYLEEEILLSGLFVLKNLKAMVGLEPGLLCIPNDLPVIQHTCIKVTFTGGC